MTHNIFNQDLSADAIDKPVLSDDTTPSLPPSTQEGPLSDTVGEDTPHLSMARMICGYLYFPLTLLITVFLFAKILLLTIVPSESMYPTFQVGEICLASKLAAQKDHARGDIIIFYCKEIGALATKRIIGTPGDTLIVTGGSVYVNGELLDESEYLSADVVTDGNFEVTVPEGCYFVMGDNRPNSADSRVWADPFVRTEDIVGVHLFGIYIPVIGPALGAYIT